MPYSLAFTSSNAVLMKLYIYIYIRILEFGTIMNDKKYARVVFTISYK